MDDLSYLQELGLITSDNQPVPIVGEFKVVKNGVIFQQFCRNGLRYDIAVSWLQKAIRLGKTEEALYCAYHIADLGNIFVSHLLNRLATIVSEDIGPAEPGLIFAFGSLYRKLYHDRKLPWKDELLRIIPLLCMARKSRIADLTIHKVQDDPGDWDDLFAGSLDQLPDNINDACMWMVFLTTDKTKEKTQLSYTNAMGKKIAKSKGLYIYQLWQLMVDASVGKSYYGDVIELLEMYQEPQVEGDSAGLLFLSHAINLVYQDTRPTHLIADLEKDAKARWEDTCPNLPQWKDLKWKDLEKLTPPIRNSAVDTHTFYGKKYLGRGSYDFYKFGSKVDNWKPFPEEEDMVSAAIERNRVPNTDIKPRKYQQRMIDEVVDQFEEEDSGWLNMACGTGKTKTSYWITHKYLESQGVDKYLVIVVLPLLEILRQFLPVWHELNIQNKNESLTGIIASCTDSFRKSEYSNYEYLKTAEHLEAFTKRTCKHKYVFTTYKSLDKLLSHLPNGIKGIEKLTPDFIVYDEAHHISKSKVSSIGKKLMLTATLKGDHLQYGPVFARYGFEEAIKDGMLTNYQINIFRMAKTDAVDYLATDCLEVIMKKCNKVIVYSRYNTVAEDVKEDYDMYKEDEIKTFYINCKTGKAARADIFRKYRKAKKAVIFNCAILGEGVDFPDCDGVYVQSGYVSEKRVIQAAGRPLRLYKGKDKAQIYLMGDKSIKKRLAALKVFDSNSLYKIRYVTV